MLSNEKTKCSAAWNKFVRDNKLKLNYNMIFNMVSENKNGVVIEVEILANN